MEEPFWTAGSRAMARHSALRELARGQAAKEGVLVPSAGPDPSHAEVTAKLERVRDEIAEILRREGVWIWCPGHGEDPVLCDARSEVEVELPAHN